MNSKAHTLSPVLIAGVIGVFSLLGRNSVLAIEPPPDNAKPPAALLNEAENIHEVQAKLPFIGVVTASLPKMLTDHLDLKPGTGVIVRTVLPNSPADQSGLKTNDIILKINETAINDPEAFGTKIRDLKIGDKLKLKTIQRGNPTDIEVTLTERPFGQLAEIPNQEPLLEGLPDAQALRLKDLIERNLGALGKNGLKEMLVPDVRADEKLQMLRDLMNHAMGDEQKIHPDQSTNIPFQQQSTIRMIDNDGSVEIKSSGESTEVIVRDKSNAEIWSGPWDTEPDKAAAPDDIRERIEKLNIKKGKGFSFRFGR